jgi:hypothetical protein
MGVALMELCYAGVQASESRTAGNYLLLAWLQKTISGTFFSL